MPRSKALNFTDWIKYLSQIVARKQLPWDVVGHSVCGSSHAASGLENQDAFKVFQKADSGYPAIMAISDGHGDRRSFRSKAGAEIAVSVAIHSIQYFLLYCHQLTDVRSITEQIYQGLPEEIHSRWLKEVEAHWDQNPPTDAETTEATFSPTIYGTTLLAFAIDQFKVHGKNITMLVFLQIGDGDILLVSPSGKTRFCFDNEQIGDVTTSLSAPNAWRSMNIHFLLDMDKLPEMILLSTDGYRKSFQRSTDFLKVGSDILGFARLNGIAATESALDEWLKGTSEQGSGDDITVCLAINNTIKAR
jgi:hypothetical protein